MTKEEALLISREYRHAEVNICSETENYYIFGDKDCTDIGGPRMPVAINKKDGRPLWNWVLATIHHEIEDSDILREWNVDEKGNFTLIEQ